MYFVTVFIWYILISTMYLFQKFSAVIISKFFCISDLNSCWISWRILMPSAFCKIPNRKNWKIQVVLKVIWCFVKLIRISYHQLFRSILETASEFIGIPFVKQNRLLLFYWILEFRWRLLHLQNSYQRKGKNASSIFLEFVYLNGRSRQQQNSKVSKAIWKLRQKWFWLIALNIKLPFQEV